MMVQPIEVEARMLLGTRDEGYSLVVPADGSYAVLRANSTLGLFRGLKTFTWLWFTYRELFTCPVHPLRFRIPQLMCVYAHHRERKILGIV
jgi:beta-acetyl hexosaminidase like